jgi:hypothetical protein
MNRLYASCALLLCAAMVSCAHAMPRASMGDFTDQILEPLALRVADEKIIEAGAAFKAARTPKASTQTMATLLTDIPWIGKLLSFSSVSRKAQLDEELIWLETRRMPLKRELLDLLVFRTTQDDDTFMFCLDNVQRRYQAMETGRFTRLPDGPGPCEFNPLLSLTKDRRSS